MKAISCSVVLFNVNCGGDGTDVFMEAADMLRDSVRFGHVSDEETLTKYSFKNAIVLFRPKTMSNKFEPDNVKYEGAVSKIEIKKFIKENLWVATGNIITNTATYQLYQTIVSIWQWIYLKFKQGSTILDNKNYTDIFLILRSLFQ